MCVWKRGLGGWVFFFLILLLFKCLDLSSLPFKPPPPHLSPLLPGTCLALRSCLLGSRPGRSRFEWGRVSFSAETPTSGESGPRRGGALGPQVQLRARVGAGLESGSIRPLVQGNEDGGTHTWVLTHTHAYTHTGAHGCTHGYTHANTRTHTHRYTRTETLLSGL